ncbi:hypothetical protein, partial [Escherichia coli]|uniref:hypothetical protein n=12 Tax=Escherichia coli TaxID=562 RepID=UPI001BE41C60
LSLWAPLSFLTSTIPSLPVTAWKVVKGPAPCQKHPKFQVFTALTDGWKSECGTCAWPAIALRPGKTERDQKAPIIDEVILKWSKMPPDERAKDSVIDYLRSLPSCQDDHHVTY